MAKVFWTEARDAQLLKLFASHSAREVATQLGCTENAIYTRANALGFRKVDNRVGWTDEENDRLAELYPVTDNAVLSRIFGRSVHAVMQQARKLGARKPPRGRGSEPLNGEHDDCDDKPYTEIEITPGHRHIHFGRNAPHNHSIRPRHVPPGGCSLDRG